MQHKDIWTKFGRNVHKGLWTQFL